MPRGDSLIVVKQGVLMLPRECLRRGEKPILELSHGEARSHGQVRNRFDASLRDLRTKLTGRIVVGIAENEYGDDGWLT